MKEQQVNEQLFAEMFKKVYPEFYVLMDLMQKNNLNVYMVFRILRHLVTISNGTGWGDIKIIIKRNKILEIHGNETEQVIEDIRVNNHVIMLDK